VRGLFDKIAGAFEWLDALEFVIPAILAALLLVFGPLLAFLYFLRTQHYAAAVISGGLWILATVGGMRDWRRRHFGWVSVTFGVVWFIMTLILWWRLQTL
jgi:hypothetical protein